MMFEFTCILVDDDLVSRLVLKTKLIASGLFKILGTFTNAEEALIFLKKETPEVLFLDIDMPDLNGMELRKQAMDAPVCIFVSAHPEYALDAFGLSTLDFLTKPIDDGRFEHMLERVKNYMTIYRKAQNAEYEPEQKELINVTHNGLSVSLDPESILYLEALKDYTLLVTKDRKYYVHNYLGTLLTEDRFQSFIRIHRSYAVQRSSLYKVTRDFATLSNKKMLPIGRMYKDNLKK